MSSHSVNSTLGPAQQVLNTTELLENILSFLPMPHVLGKSRVSRKWKAVIDNSPALQDKLFLRYKDSQAEVLRCDHLFLNFRGWPREWTEDLGYEKVDLLFSLAFMPVYTTPIELNPILGWENQAKLHITHEVAVAPPELYHPSPAGFKAILGKYSTAYVRHRFGQSWQREQCNSSWCRMYLTKPPITDIVIHVPTIVGAESSSLHQVEHIKINIQSWHGVTLGLLCDKVEDMLKEVQMRDGGHSSQKKNDGSFKEDDFVRGWNEKQRVMFLVQPKKDAVDPGSQ